MKDNNCNADVLVVLPARRRSTRLPDKPLLDIHGQPMIVHTWRRAMAAQVGAVVVATDDPDIAAAVRAVGGEAVMTRADHVSGSDRVAEVARGRSESWIVNLQGDEPLFDPAILGRVLEPLRADAALGMATLAHPLHEWSDIVNPNVVKVVCSALGRALYFSRAPIPFDRDSWGHHLPRRDEPVSDFPPMLRHIGVYAYRRDFLLEWTTWPEGRLERLERLEQLRVLEAGHPIGVAVVDHGPVGVDTWDDLERVRQLLAREGGL
ncbi:MAG: 3-deoxy-manno-octulosonate cytidylyltransferase [Alphaproteobacteria bacterium CG_4_10_14_0_2_um_filter_63_37]|nr:MAG: hypothetical protein AUJ55_09790 [Proteobacteria bacterium CG1_02_64_396]PJA23752.1 MAG: 3-deoxy-manno-octulosonate cytidylyltransferase [Alphaproteobacteria bacterium CG_4_10_14_0_2_um_filter_63_37]